MKRPPDIVYGLEEAPPPVVTMLLGVQHVGLIAINLVYPLLVFRVAGTPADAVVASQNGLHVAVVKDGTVHLQAIKIARDFGTDVEVRDGVEPGDTVVLNPMVELTEGSSVRPNTAVPENAK